ncbi:hypothetical protein NQ315_014414 [Exocentrus adspersus]|uniref:BED-type domain-containing protein n=1 Tax=Exocentrus adspersus TaxID=1586481 RepID=A0AAV8VFZ4_9CUCU|nr:hypothetical protein NQ315_014414 [Exocentrus adspersus]
MNALKQKSLVWKFFDICEEDESKAKCKLCKHEKLISQGGKGKKASTSPLLFHLKTFHKNEYDGVSVNKEDSTIHTQPSLKQDLNDTRATKFNYIIGEMIAVDNQPFAFVEDLGFRRLLSNALPHYKLPSRHFFSDTILPDIYQRVGNQNMINETKFVSLTSDIWTCSHNNESFISISGHFIIKEPTGKSDEQELKKHHVVLSCQSFRGSHTALNIAEKITSILESWSIEKDKVHILLRDNAQNMKKGCIDCGINSEGCFIHSLQLVITGALKVHRTVTDTIASSRRIVGHFSHSALLRPFEEITKQISSSESIFSDVIPCITMLNRYLSETQVFGLGSMKTSLEEGLRNRFIDIENNKYYYIATILDPRFKLKFFSTADQAVLAKNNMLRDLRDLRRRYHFTFKNRKPH